MTAGFGVAGVQCCVGRVLVAPGSLLEAAATMTGAWGIAAGAALCPVVAGIASVA